MATGTVAFFCVPKVIEEIEMRWYDRDRKFQMRKKYVDHKI